MEPAYTPPPLQSASFFKIFVLLLRPFLPRSFSFSLSSLSLSFVSPLLFPSLACSLTLSLSLFFTLCLLPSVQVFPHANAKSTELLGIIAAPGLDSRREYISSTLVGKLCLWSGTGRRRYGRWGEEGREGSNSKEAQRFLVCETFLWTRYGLLSFANTALRAARIRRESSRKSLANIHRQICFPRRIPEIRRGSRRFLNACGSFALRFSRRYAENGMCICSARNLDSLVATFMRT